MEKKVTFLGIETSCDETAAAIVKDNSDGTGEILSNIVSSQVEEHREFGGIVPELAARAHVEKIEFIVQKAIEESNLDLENLDGIAATAGPGLIVCLTVGLNAGKAIAGTLKKLPCLQYLIFFYFEKYLRKFLLFLSLLIFHQIVN